MRIVIKQQNILLSYDGLSLRETQKLGLSALLGGFYLSPDFYILGGGITWNGKSWKKTY